MLRLVRRPFFWVIALVIAVFVIAPSIGNNVELRESLILAALYITLASNINLMLGYAGYINFGSIVFFGLGGYICVWLVNAHAWPLGISLLVAGICVSILALIFGLGILRLRGAFFALATIGVNEGVQAAVQNFTPWGGSSGMYLSPAIFQPARRAGPGALGDVFPHGRGDGTLALPELRDQDLEIWPWSTRDRAERGRGGDTRRADAAL